MRRKEGYLSHSFRPEEAIRLMALTRGQQHLWLQSWALPPPSFLSCGFLLCPAAHVRIQPGPGPRSRRAGCTAVVSTPCLRKFSIPDRPRQIQAARLATGTSRDGRGNWRLGPEMALNPGGWEASVASTRQGTTTFI